MGKKCNGEHSTTSIRKFQGSLVCQCWLDAYQAGNCEQKQALLATLIDIKKRELEWTIKQSTAASAASV